jgi:phosphopantothenoylcysteine decarboxylase/phosphopantothenate--cysteine ligase
MRVLITAGPTAEDIDPVRYLTNRSTGRMGMEVAAAVLRAGGEARLVLGPTPLPVPAAIPESAVVRVRSAQDMCDAVVANLGWCTALVMSAAVADYTPAEPLDTKLKKGDGDFFLRLRRTPDILATIQHLPERQGKCVIGFSLDVAMNMEEGRRKLRAKHLDAIVVNTTASFGSDKERACIVSENASDDLGEITKPALAEKLVSLIA